jgi:hypothetical protein
MALYGKVAGNLAEYGICDSEKRANSSSIWGNSDLSAIV